MAETKEQTQRLREACQILRNTPAGKVLFEHLDRRLEAAKDAMLTNSGDELLRRQGGAQELRSLIKDLSQPPA